MTKLEKQKRPVRNERGVLEMIEKSLAGSGFPRADGEEEHEAAEHQLDDTPGDVDVVAEGFRVDVAALGEETVAGQDFFARFAK